MSGVLKGGRVAGLKEDALKFVSSVKSDVKILKYVLDVNKAHIIMLIEGGIIPKDDGLRILNVLLELDESFPLRSDVEDVHVIVEEEVIRRAGMDVGGNINIAKSRNDQVATAIRMALRDEILGILDAALALQESLLEVAEKNIDVIIPGYTHLQPAQPTTFAHYLLAQFDALQRDIERLLDAYRRANLCPMGAGALATTSFPISRERVAELLGFNGLVENSIDAVRSRDFLLEVLAALSIMAVNLSHFIEDLILWSSMEFNLIDLPEEFTSTSSIMPQKKNPDVLEVMRARMSLIISDFMAASMILKGLPSTYNLDFQEATPKLWDACDIARESLKLLSDLIRGVRVKVEVFNRPFLGFMAATEIANMLVREYNLPFRVAHKIVGYLVKVLINSGKTLSDVTPSLFAEVSSHLFKKPINVREEDLRRIISLEGFLESHGVKGGPSSSEVKRMLSERIHSLDSFKEEVASLRKRITSSKSKLSSIVRLYASASTGVYKHDSNV
ncbi:MAG: argininosuccinate lyase [Candidatus Bathyarchaeia archaeon]